MFIFIKNKIIVLILLLLTLKVNSIAQIDTTLKDYFPMQVGNLWEYYQDDGIRYYFYQVKVIGDTVMPNGLQYKVFWDSTQFLGSGEPRLHFYRIDSSMNVWEYVSENAYMSCNGEYQIFKLNLPDRTIWKDCRHPFAWINSGTNFPCLARTEIIGYWLLGVIKTTKVFCGAIIDTVNNDTSFCGSFYYVTNWLAKDIGRTWMAGGGASLRLKGAIINGYQYGSITNITDQHQIIPDYMLYQNFPNPFNSVTRIKYILKFPSNVTLKIFNLLAQEISTIVDEYQNPGSYEVVFDTKNIKDKLPSGIYYYTIYAGSFIQTKKMILLK